MALNLQPELALLLDRQDKATQRIKSTYEGYKKTPTARRTLLALNNAIKLINEIWDEVTHTNQQIDEIELTEYQRREPYFVDNVFDRAHDCKAKFIAALEQEKILFTTETEEPKPGPSTGPSTVLSTEKDIEQQGRYKVLQLRLKGFNSLLQRLEIQATQGILDHQTAKAERQTLTDEWEKISTLYETIVINEHSATTDIAFKRNMSEHYESFTTLFGKRMNQLAEVMAAKTADKKGSVFQVPVVKIPTFDGTQKDWQGFSDVFGKLIHEDEQLLDIQKFLTLKPLLKGEAATVLSQLPISEANYKTAWKLLQDKYNNKRVQVNMHINNIRAIQPISRGPIEKISEQLSKIFDTMQENLRGLDNLKVSRAEAMEAMIVNQILEKLDTSSAIAFEQSLENTKTIPKIEELLKFIECRATTLLGATAGTRNVTYNDHSQGQLKRSVGHSHAVTNKIPCFKCHGPHALYLCSKFKEMSVPDRWTFVKQKICTLCLGHKYVPGSKCTYDKKCFKCTGYHHTLLHSDGQGASHKPSYKEKRTDWKGPTGTVHTAREGTKEDFHVKPMLSGPPEPTQQDGVWVYHRTGHPPMTPVSGTKTMYHSHAARPKRPTVLLPTALVKVVSKNSPTTINLRVLVDQGSTLTMITRRATRLLKLQEYASPVGVQGVGKSSAGDSSTVTKLILEARHGKEFKLPIFAQVLSTLTSALPSKAVPFETAPDFTFLGKSNAVLADPTFNQPGEIDIILGSDYFTQIALPGMLVSPEGVLAQETRFGWTVSGPVPDINHQEKMYCNIVTVHEISEELQRFMTQEEPVLEQAKTVLDNHCEASYIKNVGRQENGRYIVKMQFEDDDLSLGHSRQQAIARLLQVEKRLNANPMLREQYNKFMREYTDLDHMEKLTGSAILPSKTIYYLPHHCVFNEGSLSTKIRVVFDGSCSTSNGISINDKMLAGPRLQENLDAILLRWRKHKYAFTADIEKMYRQILIDDEQHDLQR